MLGEGRARGRRLPPPGGVLAAMKLSSRIGDRAGHLPPAEVQRLALAVALVNRPRLLLADELTAGVEWTAVRELLNDLDGALNRNGATAIIVTHDSRLQSDVEPAIVIRDGNIRTG